VTRLGNTEVKYVCGRVAAGSLTCVGGRVSSRAVSELASDDFELAIMTKNENGAVAAWNAF